MIKQEAMNYGIKEKACYGHEGYSSRGDGDP